MKKEQQRQIGQKSKQLFDTVEELCDSRVFTDPETVAPIFSVLEICPFEFQKTLCEVVYEPEVPDISQEEEDFLDSILSSLNDPIYSDVVS